MPYASLTLGGERSASEAAKLDGPFQGILALDGVPQTDLSVRVDTSTWKGVRSSVTDAGVRFRIESKSADRYTVRLAPVAPSLR